MRVSVLLRTVGLLFLTLFFLAPALSIGTGPAQAQTTDNPLGTIRGDIRDAVSGRSVAGAQVKLIDGPATDQSVVTGSDGSYALDAVPEGLFTLHVTQPGYVDAVEIDVRVVRDRVTRADFQLARQALAIDEILVTAKAVGITQFGSVTATRLGREEIRRGAGTAGDVFRGLDVLPGVSNTGEFSNFTVRGRGPRDNLILIDGIPFDKVVHFDRSLGDEEDIGGGGRFSIFAPNIIGGAEFQAGGWDAAYSGRSGSLLKLDIAEGNPDDPSVSARLDIAGGEITYDGPSYVAGNTSVLLSARYFDFGNLFKVIGQKDIGDPESGDFLFKSVTDLNDRHSISLLGLYSPEDYTRDVENVLESDDFEDTSLLTTEQDSLLLGATWTWLVGNEGKLTNAVFLRDSDKTSRLGEAFPDLTGVDQTADQVIVRENILNLTETEQEIGWRGDYTTPTPWGVLSAGARYSRVELDFDTRLDGDWIRYVYDQNDFRSDPSQKFIVLTPARLNSAFTAKESRIAGYMDHAFYLGDFTLRPGVRFDRDGFSEESLWSPRLSADWQLGTATRLSATAGVYYQTPRVLELAADPANNRLENERTNQVSLGLEHYLTPDLKVAGEVYYQDLENLVVPGDETSGLAFNSGDGDGAGIDLSVQKRMSNEWSASLAYSFSRAKRDDNLGEGEYNADFHRPHVLTLAAAWQPNDRWALAAKWKYASGRPTDGFIINADIFNDPNNLRFSKEITTTNTERLRDFHALNIRIDYRRQIGGVSVITFLDVINAYGRTNIDSLEFDERRGVNVFGDLNVFPQIGLKLEF
ncbi:MAG: TonB-dependent receptor [Rhodospirillaceae bacterium]